ncbi:unnamed protein product [Phytophthora fragariaefolia]|uniref:Unnamed protein product n=1 Tax=Phytophthora fragariaefolia TaxID=1490495 RepID=A0A9W6XKZ8_9STRA|nr:unnamed protein product [Phytophthora fragariaefolia]
MRVHESVWKYAELHGSVFAVSYAQKRQTISVENRRKSNAVWLLREGGQQLRKPWSSLSNDDRSGFMPRFADPTFPDRCSASIATSVSDILARLRGVAAFQPEYRDSVNESSIEFSLNRIQRAHTAYGDAVAEIYKICQATDINVDPDRPILEAPTVCFWKTPGIPLFTLRRAKNYQSKMLFEETECLTLYNLK